MTQTNARPRWDWQRIKQVLETARLPGLALGRLLFTLVLTSVAAALVADRFAGPNGPWIWNFDAPRLDVPLATFFHDALSAGHLPLWSDGIRLGYPLYAEGHIGAFYPPNWLIYLLPPLQALDLSRVLHLALAGVGAGLITLRLSGSRTGALATAVIAVLGGGIAGKLEWSDVVVVYGWMPWVLLPLVWRRSGPTPSLATIAGVVWGVQALGGYPPYWVLTGIAAVVVIVARRPTMTVLRALVMFGVVGLLVGGIQLLPTAVLTQLSHRSAGIDRSVLFEYSATPFDFLGFGFANSYVNPGGPAWDLLRTWYPGGFWAVLESFAYVGLPALALATVGLRVRRARPFVLLAALGFAIPVIAAFQPPLLGAIYAVFRHPIRAYLLVDLAIAILAGVAFARLGRTGRWRDAAAVLVGMFGLYAAVTILAAAPSGFLWGVIDRLWQVLIPVETEAARHLAVEVLVSAWPLALELILAVAALLALRVRRRLVFTRLSMVGLVSIPLVLFVPAINQSLPAAAFSSERTALVQALRDVAPRAVLTVGEPYGPALDAVLGGPGAAGPHMFSAQLAVAFELQGSGTILQQLRERPDSSLARALGIDTIVTYGQGACPGTALISLPSQSICHLDGAVSGPYWMPGTAVVSTSAEPASPVSPIEVTINPDAAVNGAVRATVLSWSDAGASIAVDAPAAGYMFIDRSWWPNWRVSVDGSPARVYSAWGGQLIFVPAGRHLVEEEFLAWDVLIGGIMSLCGVVLAVIAFWILRRRDHARLEAGT